MDRNDKDWIGLMLLLLCLPFILMLFEDFWKLLVVFIVSVAVLITSGFGVYYLLS